MIKNALHIDQASEAIQAARLAKCRDCGELKRFQAALSANADIGLRDTCAICGCFVRAKAKLESEKCPKGLWLNETDGKTV